MSPRQQAIANGDKTYHGKPCKRGHTEKYVSNRKCVECMRIRDAGRTEYNRQYHAEHPDRIKEHKRNHKKANPGKYAAYANKRRAAKLQRTPKWLTKDDHDLIKQIYIRCAEITDSTGIPHQVDHIFPLQGEDICGLHDFPNLQIIPADENQSKSNRLQ